MRQKTKNLDPEVRAVRYRREFKSPGAGHIKGAAATTCLLLISAPFRRGSIESVSKRRGVPSVKVECESGELYYADHLICALPIGKFDC